MARGTVPTLDVVVVDADGEHVGVQHEILADQPGRVRETLSLEKSEDASVSWVYNIGYALAPAVQFLVDWWPGDEGGPPTRLSRHVSIHNASTEHMTKLNATIAIMLATGMSVALNYPMRLMLRPDS